jgi:uncharacterized protein (DUF362 family)
MPLSRRDFIKSSISVIGSSFFLKGCSNKLSTSRNLRQTKKFFFENGKPKLIALESSNPDKALEMGFDALGDLKSIILPEYKVVIKPNFVFPEPYPATTDFGFVEILVRKLHDIGVQNITLIDCSHKTSFKFHQVIEKSEKIGIRAKLCPPNDLTYYNEVVNTKWRCSKSLMVQKDILNSDFLISVPVLKRHGEANMSCAMKNHFGSISGFHRYWAHGRSRLGNIDFFMDTMAEFADAVRPELTIVDARDILTKGGPSISSGVVKRGINKLILTQDMVACDAYCSDILENADSSFSKEMMKRTFDHAYELGVGFNDLKNVIIKEISA